MQSLWQDLRFGARMLVKQPAFTLIAVVTLALGVGANTAIFSVVNGLLLRPLAYHEPERLVTVLSDGNFPISPANFLDARTNNRSFAHLAAAEAWGGTLTGTDKPEQLSGLRMGEGLFDLLGVPPLLGRTLRAEDYEAGQDHVLVLSHKLWQRSFGGDAAVIGKPVRLNGESYTVVGVMPPQFQFPPFWSTRAELWAPLDLRPRATQRGASSLRVFARLQPQATLEQAQLEIAALSQQLAAAYPAENARLDLRVTPLNEKVVGNVRPSLLAIAATAGLVLLIACANVACLLLARAAARQKEIALRGALGAGRWRLVRQMLTESALLALGGALLGAFLAFWGVEWLTNLLAGNSSSFSVKVPRLNEVRVDGAALLFALVTALLTNLLFGLLPALAAAKPDLNQVLKEGGRGVAGGGARGRALLVVAELALSLVLLIGAGLLLNSFVKLQALDAGFDARNLLTATVSLNGATQYRGPTREAFYRQLTERLQALPGVTAVSAINHLPLAGDTWGVPVAIENQPLPPPGQGLSATFRVTRPAYFRAMGAALRTGRDFTERDAADAPGVVIVNERLAQRVWPNANPLGQRLTLDDPRDTAQPPRWLTVVGVAPDIKQESWTERPRNEVYLPFQQGGGFYAGAAGRYTAMTLVLRTAVAPETLVQPVQEAVRALDRNVPVSNVVNMEQIVADTLWQPRFLLQLIGLFAALALALAGLGLYGVMAYTVTQRKAEVGLRMALGAGRGDVLRLLVGQGMRLVLAGVGAGLALAFALARLMAKLLYGVSATDPLTFAATAGLLALVGLLACGVPAWRATRVDPLTALRHE